MEKTISIKNTEITFSVSRDPRLTIGRNAHVITRYGI